MARRCAEMNEVGKQKFLFSQSCYWHDWETSWYWKLQWVVLLSGEKEPLCSLCPPRGWKSSAARKRSGKWAQESNNVAFLKMDCFQMPFEMAEITVESEFFYQIQDYIYRLKNEKTQIYLAQMKLSLGWEYLHYMTHVWSHDYLIQWHMLWKFILFKCSWFTMVQ